VAISNFPAGTDVNAGRRVLLLLVAGVMLATGLAACGGGKSQPSAADTLNVIGGSELKDMAPILADAQKQIGIKVNLSYTGSLDGADKIANGAAGTDAAWFASDRYIALAGASNKVLESKRIMQSPVIIGVKKSVASRLGWQPNTVTWQDIASAAAAGKFKYAMTSPTASNSGFSALVGVADALTGGKPLTVSSIDANGLKGFLSGQALTSGSSGFLVDSYEKSQDSLDGIVNYESVLVSMNASNALHEPLTLLYPKDGIITADYPLMLLNSSKRAAFDKLTAYLTQPDVQAKIQQVTARRAATPGVPPDPRLNTGVLIEATFPANLDVVQHLLDEYSTELRRPANTVYVLDTSGSMGSDSPSRIDRLKQALDGLAGSDTSFSGHFSRFNPRETVTLIPFSDQVADSKTFNIDSTDPSSQALTSLRQFVDGLQPDGGTAIYSALQQAYTTAGQQQFAHPDAYTSVVLMTDGENNEGISAQDFLDYLNGLPANVRSVRVFAVLFGEGSSSELTQIATATGGQVFDARNTPLSEVFKDIRGYQ
jgi:Ca-activated chloride channel family protein